MWYEVSGRSWRNQRNHKQTLCTLPGVSNRPFGNRTDRTPIVRQDSAIELNPTHTKIWSMEQNRTFDWRTVDNRPKSNVRLPNGRPSYSIKRAITELLMRKLFTCWTPFPVLQLMKWYNFSVFEYYGHIKTRSHFFPNIIKT